ncbi:porin family protein [Hyphobacterium sp.]|uniref:porin family protein n=1 Tax=Hyphobacterium sp. TaxID=2004662 RepID=UPI003BAC4438
MLRTLASASALALAAAASSFAGEGDFTVGAGYSHVDLDGASVGAITLRGGYEFTNYLGVEGQVDIGIADDTVTVLATPIDVELNYAASLFGVARAPLAPNFNLLARIGYTTAEVEASVPGFSLSDDADGFAYGVGAEFFVDDHNGFRFDYTRHDFDGGDGDVFGLHYVRRFGGR